MTGLYDQIRQYFISVFTAREPGTRGTTGIPEHAVCSPQPTALPKARSRKWQPVTYQIYIKRTGGSNLDIRS